MNGINNTQRYKVSDKSTKQLHELGETELLMLPLGLYQKYSKNGGIYPRKKKIVEFKEEPDYDEKHSDRLQERNRNGKEQKKAKLRTRFFD